MFDDPKNNISVLEAQNHLDQLRKDFNERDADLVSRINTARERGREKEVEQLTTQLNQLQGVYQPAFARAQLAIDLAKQHEQAQQQALQERRNAILEGQKARYKAEWIRKGGDAESFERNWPTMRENLLRNAVVNDVDKPLTGQGRVKL